MEIYLTLYSLGRLGSAIFAILIFLFLTRRWKKNDSGTHWFTFYFLFLILFNIGYIFGYSIFSEIGSFGWVLACFFAFAAVARLQIAYTFPTEFAAKERKWVLWIGLLLSSIAFVDYLIHFRSIVHFQFSIHSYGSRYSSFLVPFVGFISYFLSIIVSFRRIVKKITTLKRTKRSFQFRKSFFDREILITISLIVITFFEFFLTSFYFLGYVQYISTSILAEVMNLGILFIFSSYALVYTSSTVGRTGFIPRLLGFILVFLIFFSTLVSRYYERKSLELYKQTLESGINPIPKIIISKLDFDKYKIGKVSDYYFDGIFYFVKLENHLYFAVFNPHSHEFLIYDYLVYRQFLHQLLLPSFYFQFFAMIFVITVFPIVFKISFVFPLNQLIKDIQFELLRDKKFKNNHSEEDRFELTNLKNAFLRIGDMIRNAKKELEEVSKPLDVIEIYINENPKEIKIGNHTLIYKSNSFDKTIHEVYQASRYPHPVTITGETGCGKELVAKLIHQSSEYKEGPFLAINCATLPESLWEAEIFGAKKGSYTDSKADRKGRIEEASGGSIFFDEIGEMPISIQAKMLRLLQENKFVPIGANVEQNVQCRFIFATNQNLDELVKKKLFREDLLYRIKVFHIHLIPLRERLEDIPHLLHFFISRFQAKFNRIEPKFTDEAMSQILSYHWPGNIRELENFVTRIMSQTSKDVLQPSDILQFLTHGTQNAFLIRTTENPFLRIGLEEEIKDLTKNRIFQALKEENGNITRAAERLDLKRTTLLYKMKELGIVDKKSNF